MAETPKTKALANPAQAHGALLHELERYVDARNPGVTNVNVVKATDTGQADTSHKPRTNPDTTRFGHPAPVTIGKRYRRTNARVSSTVAKLMLVC